MDWKISLLAEATKTHRFIGEWSGLPKLHFAARVRDLPWAAENYEIGKKCKWVSWILELFIVIFGVYSTGGARRGFEWVS